MVQSPTDLPVTSPRQAMSGRVQVNRQFRYLLPDSSTVNMGRTILLSQMAPNTSPARRVSRIFCGGVRPPEDDLVPGTAAERLQMMWPLTLEAWAFRGESIEPRLQRHTVRIVRGRR